MLLFLAAFSLDVMIETPHTVFSLDQSLASSTRDPVCPPRLGSSSFVVVVVVVLTND